MTEEQQKEIIQGEQYKGVSENFGFANEGADQLRYDAYYERDRIRNEHQDTALMVSLFLEAKKIDDSLTLDKFTEIYMKLKNLIKGE